MANLQAPVTAKARPINPLVKNGLELGPLVLFFVAYTKFGMFTATGVLMASVLAALAVSYWLTRRLPVMPLVTAVGVLIFGGLTLVLHDQTFIKVKATIVYVIFGTALLGALAFGRPLLPVMLDSMLKLDAEGWRKLTLRWGLFFYGLAILNEIVWRTQPDSIWVSFKVFGVMPLTFLFALAQVPLIMKHEAKPDDTTNEM